VDDDLDRLARPSRALRCSMSGLRPPRRCRPVLAPAQADYQALSVASQEYINGRRRVPGGALTAFRRARDGVDRSTCIASCGHQSLAVMFPPGIPRGCRDRRLTEVLVRLDGRRVDVRPAVRGRRGRSVGGDKPWKRNCARSQGAGRPRHADRPRPQRRGSGGAPGSVRLDDIMVVDATPTSSPGFQRERHPIDGLPQGCVRATFPAARSRARPKIRAMEIIDVLEPSRRGSRRCVGYLSYTGPTWTCEYAHSVPWSPGRTMHDASRGRHVAPASPRTEHMRSA